MTRVAARPTVLLILAALLVAGLGPVPHAKAAARVTIANELGDARADSTYSTTITVSGSGFQSVAGAFGGVYLFFGTVGSGWQPSTGGVSGVDFRYVPDSEARDNAGYQRFIAFPGSSTSTEAHATMSESGSWSVTMTVPGPTFQSAGRSGGIETVDCREVTCGIISVGAHGVPNANNETFTPITFADLYSSPEDDEGAQADETGDGDEAVSKDDEAYPGEPTEPVKPTLDVDPATAVVGRVMTFTARGFEPGEQVVGSLGAGLAAVGPLVAGAQGEVAGAIQLPSDVRAGTLGLALSGAASGARAEVSFQVAAAPSSPAPAAPVVVAEPESVWSPSWQWIALGVAAALLLVVIALGLVTAVRERRRSSVPPPTAPVRSLEEAS